VSVKASSNASRTFQNLVLDTERVEYHGDVQSRNTSTDNAHRELGNGWKNRGRDEDLRIDRRPRLPWVRIYVDKAFNGILSSLGECLRAGVRFGRSWSDFALENVDCDQAVIAIVRVEYMIQGWRWTYESSYSAAPGV